VGFCRPCQVHSNETECFVCGETYGPRGGITDPNQQASRWRHRPDAEVVWHGMTFAPLTPDETAPV